MKIDLKQFGTTLISRQNGREAWLALQSLLKNIDSQATIEVNFNGIVVLTPGWADEFITPLSDKYKKRLQLKNTDNPSVKATLSTLRKAKESLD